MYYLITICHSRVKNYISDIDLTSVINYLKYCAAIKLIYGKWERHGMYKQLHYHGIFWIPKGVFYSKYTKAIGFHLHFESIDSKRDFPRIKRYIDKHYNKYNNTQLDTQLANYVHSHYLFT